MKRSILERIGTLMIKRSVINEIPACNLGFANYNIINFIIRNSNNYINYIRNNGNSYSF